MTPQSNKPDDYDLILCEDCPALADHYLKGKWYCETHFLNHAW